MYLFISVDDEANAGEEGDGKPAFTVLLHGSLKVAATTALVQLG